MMRISRSYHLITVGIAFTLILVGIIAPQQLISEKINVSPTLTTNNLGPNPGAIVYNPASNGLSTLGGQNIFTPSGQAGNGGGGGGGGGWGGAVPQALGAITKAQTPGIAGPTIIPGVNDANTIAAYQTSINSTNNALNNLGQQQQVGSGNIQDAYNSALNNLLQGQANNQQTYNQNTTTGQQNYVGAKNTIGANAGQSLNGLERLLASRGAGGSSAATVLAPQAVATQASQQRAGAGQTYAQNQQALDTGWNNYLFGLNQNKQDLGNQLTNNQNSLGASIASNKASLLNSLAQLQGQYAAATGANPTSAAQPYLDQANTALQTATGLGQQVPVYQVSPTTYSAPTQASYTTNPFSTPQAATAGSSVLNTVVAPGLSTLLNPKTALSGVTAS